MATSGSIDLTLSRNDIVEEALQLLGVLAEGASASANQLADCGRTLNLLVKAWQAKGVNLHTVQKQYLFLQKTQSRYSLISSTTDAFTSTDPIVQTAIDGAVSSGATSFDVDDATSISDADYIGILLDSGEMQWTTVNGSPSGNTVTVDDSLLSDVDDGATVYAYTTKAQRPIRILHAVVRTKGTNDTPVEVLNRTDYTDLTNKTADGQVNQIYYNPQIGTGLLYVWPQSDVETDYLVLWVERTVEDFDADDDADFPQEWYLALTTNLAKQLIPKYGSDRGRTAMIRELAAEALYDALGFDAEESVRIQPDTSRRGT